MHRLVIVVLAAALAGCATFTEQPPIYGCEGLEEFGCPTIPPLDDPLP